MEGEFDHNSKCFKSCQKRCNNLIDVLISKIMRPTFILFMENPLYIKIRSEIFLKIIFYASIATIEENDDVFSENLFNLTDVFLGPCCYSECHNVLGDIVEIFQNYGDHFSDRWIFTFEGEIGRGLGVIKEVYSIISQELQC